MWFIRTFYEIVCQCNLVHLLCYQTVACLSVCLSVLSSLSVTWVHCGQTVAWIKMKLGTQVGLTSGQIALDGDSAPTPCPILGPYLLWPNSWMDQDATWYGGRPRLKRHWVRWGPSSPSPKKGPQPPIFGPCLLWPNGWMDQDAIWYGGRPRPRPNCARWGPSTNKGHSPQFSAHVYCGQTARWIKMALGIVVGLSPGHIVLDGDPAPSPK